MDDNTAFGIIHCEGTDAEKFLQGQLSANLLLLSAHLGALACYLNLKGRVVAMVYVIKRPDGYWLILPDDLVLPIMHKLQKFIVFSKATLKDVSKQFNIKDVVTPPVSFPAYHVEEVAHAVTFCIQPERGISIRITPSEHGPFALPTDFLRVLLEARIPWIGKAQTEHFLPHYIDLVRLGAIDFNKGCFVGQEVVARMEYRGHLNKTLAVMTMPLGSEIDIAGPVAQDNQKGEAVNIIEDEDQLLVLGSVAAV